MKTIEPWTICNAASGRTHSARPVVIVKDNDVTVDALLIGHDELRRQKDGSRMLSSLFYSQHPEYDIDPVIIDDERSCGLFHPSFVNVNCIRKIPKAKIDTNFPIGELNQETISKIEPLIPSLPAKRITEPQTHFYSKRRYYSAGGYNKH